MVYLWQTFTDLILTSNKSNLLRNLLVLLDQDFFDALLLINQAGYIQTANSCACDLLKASPEDICQLNVSTLIMADPPLGWQTAIQSSDSFAGQGMLHQPQGTVLPVQFSSRRLSPQLILLRLVHRLPDGVQTQENQHLKRTISDLNQRLLACQATAAELKQSERLFHSAFNQTFQLSSLLTPEGMIIEDNQTALAFCGLDRSQAVGKPFTEMHCWKSSELAKSRLLQAISAASAGQTIRYEVEILDPQNNPVTIDFSLKPSFDETGRVEFLIAEGRSIADRKQAELALQASEQRFRSVLEQIPLLAIILDRQARVIFCNNYLLDLVGWNQGEVIHQTWSDLIVPERQCQESFRRAFDDILNHGTASSHCEYEILTRWGEKRLISWRSTALYDQNQQMIEIASIGEDITERRRGEQKLQAQTVQEQLLADITHQVRQSLDLETILTTAVNQIHQVLRADQVVVFQLEAEGKGRVIAASQSGGSPIQSSFPRIPRPVNVSPLLRQPGPHLIDAPIVQETESGEISVWGLLIVHLSNQANDFLEVEWFLRQLANQLAIAIYQSELYQQAQAELLTRQQAVARFQHDALHDALTGLPNYSYLLPQIQRLLGSQDAPTPCQFAILFLDLNNFKQVNDTYGHSVGDQLLQVVAQRLKTCIRETDLLARRSGDEFLLLLHPIDTPAEALAVAQRVHLGLQAPVVLNRQAIITSVSIGIATGPADYSDPETILQHADLAMYEAKRKGLVYQTWPLES